jgi:mono/diheme cytochrome c family protein
MNTGRTAIVGALTALLYCAAPLEAQNSEPQLPPGDGATIVAEVCSQCHSLNAVTQLREGRRAWRDTVYDMILRGAQVEPADVDRVVNYLTLHFGAGMLLAGPPGPPVKLPDGPGKKLVGDTCVLCHSLDRALAGKRSKGQWERIIAQMEYLGAPLSPDNAKIVTNYLSANFGAMGPTVRK